MPAPPIPARRSARTIPNSTSSIPTGNWRRLQTAAKMLGPLNEKKSLIYFASGMQLNGVDNQAQLRATINDAIRSGVTLWPIDARGLTATSPLGNATRGSQGNAGMYTGAAALAAMSNFQRSQDTLYTLAVRHGRQGVLDFNDLSLGIVNAEKSITSYYIDWILLQQRASRREIPRGSR